MDHSFDITRLREIREKFPFLTILKDNSDTYFVGIIQNISSSFLGVYLVDPLEHTDIMKLLEYGYEWWYGSNRKIPISVYLKTEMGYFKKCFRNFPLKEVSIIDGPVLSVTDLYRTKVRRRRRSI